MEAKMTNGISIQLVFLKTKSQPNDTYEELFTSSSTDSKDTSRIHFETSFVPVLEHKLDVKALDGLGDLLRTGGLKEKYGGMIFTSQRAVEAWSETVSRIENQSKHPTAGHGLEFPHIADSHDLNRQHPNEAQSRFLKTDQAIDERSGVHFSTDIQSISDFPLYTVGPATSRALTTLIESIESLYPPTSTSNRQSTDKIPASSFLSLNPTVLGAHTGNGANLANYILQHYNDLHARKWFTFYEAPRLPFIPIIGMGSENYSRKRLEASDPRLINKPLLFLVGEQRRDIIPKTLMNHDQLGEKAISVEEIEVYSTIVRDGFREDFDALVSQWSRTKNAITPTTAATDSTPSRPSIPTTTTTSNPPEIVVVVVFSPQGAIEMLKSTGLLNDQGTPTPQSNKRPRYIIATIGPTTQEYLKQFGFEADICSAKPSPESLKEGITSFLQSNKLV